MSENINMVAPWPVGQDRLAHEAAGIEAAMDAPLPQLVGHLARARKDAGLLTVEVQRCQALVDSSVEGRMLDQAKKALSVARVNTELFDSAVRGKAEAVFKSTGVKDIMPGIGVKFWTTYAYVPDAVTTWARANMPSLLVLDARKLEKAAAAGVLADAPVSVIKEPRVQISADLSSYLS